MDILVELTNSAIIFNFICCGTLTLPGGWSNPMTYNLDTYIAEPNDKLIPTHLVVRKLAEPRGTWPPVAAFPLSEIIFKTSATIPFQSSNEAGS